MNQEQQANANAVAVIIDSVLIAVLWHYNLESLAVFFFCLLLYFLAELAGLIIDG